MCMPRESAGLLGDTVARDYSRKLRSFNAFAEPEIRSAIDSLSLRPGMRVLDAGCGTGEAIGWLLEQVKTQGVAVGMDLAAAHADAARANITDRALILQADLQRPPFAPASFDLIWCVNTINHLRNPVTGLHSLGALLRANGRIAVGQTGFLPDMYFAWDSRLERLVNEAVRQYYRVRYGVQEQELAGVRGLVGLLHASGLKHVRARTFIIERFSPLREVDERYLFEAIFRDTWGARLEPYLAREDYEQLTRLCDPNGPQFALRRSDFHFLQTFTLAVGEI